MHWFCLATRWPFLCHGFQFWDPRRCPKSHILSVMANSLDTFSYIVTSLPSKPHRRACRPLLCLFNENLVALEVGCISASDTNSRPPNCPSPLSMLNHGTLSTCGFCTSLTQLLPYGNLWCSLPFFSVYPQSTTLRCCFVLRYKYIFLSSSVFVVICISCYCLRDRPL